MAVSRTPGGAQKSLRDLYPNLTGILGSFENTVPEGEELDHFTAGGATANVETSGGAVRPVEKSDLLKMVGLIGVGVALLWLLGKS